MEPADCGCNSLSSAFGTVVAPHAQATLAQQSGHRVAVRAVIVHEVDDGALRPRAARRKQGADEPPQLVVVQQMLAGGVVIEHDERLAGVGKHGLQRRQQTYAQVPIQVDGRHVGRGENALQVVGHRPILGEGLL